MQSKVNVLPADIGSLSHGYHRLPPGAPGTLYVLGEEGGMSVAPDAAFTLIFGRNVHDVHVCVGRRDAYVSRRQGLITREASRWVLRNTGGRPLRLPGSRLLLRGHRVELPTGYTPLFVVGHRQEHLLEIRVAARAPQPPGAGDDLCEQDTADGEALELSPLEELVLVCLAQRYLRNDPQPQPLAWAQAAAELQELLPDRQWNEKKVARVVEKVRARLSAKGVPGLRAKEVPPPVGNALNHNLITHLLLTGTIGEEHLRLLDE